ncbi:deoxyribose-phosphate aldolase [Enemella sp. A6]|uniref:deoxyribose-phosphate aldolase n=1 Tax=Enemella sp. A6 TaxID=3440152 RepID=UPI003EBF0A51
MKKAGFIDHTLLRPDARRAEVDKLIDEALDAGFATVCVQPTWVAHAADRLRGSEVGVCTVVGFPHGASTSATKAFEAADAVERGAIEVDMVVNIGAVVDGDWDLVRSDIAAVLDAVKGRAGLKVIFETCLLTDEQIVKTCELCSDLGVAFVKTSTGFSTGGATIEAVKLMSETVTNGVQVKASGGIRTPEQFEKFLAAGANRIGASAGAALLGEVAPAC